LTNRGNSHLFFLYANSPISIRSRIKLADLGIAIAGDGNGDGFVDAADYTVWRDNLGKTFADVPPDPPATVAVFPTGDTTADIMWGAVAFATSYTVQRRSLGGGEFSDVGTNIMTTSFSDSGLTEGSDYEYQVLAKNNGGSSVPSQFASFQAGRANLTAYRPQQFHDPNNPMNVPVYAPFAKHEISEGVEESPTLGAGIRINGDDDNMSGVADYFESGASVQFENDLIEVRVDRLPGQNLVLSSDGNLAFFYDHDKATPVGLQNLTTTVPLTFTGNSATVFVEWASSGHGLERLFLRHAANLAVVDGVRFHTFHTAVVAFGGDTQVPADPVLDPNNYGVFRTAIDLYNEGYDVRMYNEEDLDWAYAEIVNSIETQGYDINDDPFDGLNGVALFGYSQGGGAVYQIAAMLEADAPPFGDLSKLFAISFTSYIDAVEYNGILPEVQRPPLSKYHLNQYQTFGAPRGAATEGLLGPDDEVNRTSPGMTHTRIDDDPVVLNLLKQRFRLKVVR
jgi:hypothetical protein